MFFKQFYLGCLAQASYLVGSGGEAAVVDPRRDVDEYIEVARAEGLRIRYVIETHLHADFVSGHRELAERTGASIVFGARAEATLPHRAVVDGDELAVGDLVLRIIETPGHTSEGISILVTDTSVSSEPKLVFTGDTLFVGDVGRPDLAGTQGMSPEQMAGMLYESLHGKLLTLADGVEVYPAHGAGSLCGRSLSQATSSSIGEERRTNPALQPMTKERFIQLATADLPLLPQYFPKDVALNRQGAVSLHERELPPALGLKQVETLAAAGAVVLDVRDAHAFGTGHVPGSLNVGLAGQFAVWAGILVPMESRIVLVAEGETATREALTRLARVGLDNVAGYLEGGVEALARPGVALQSLPQIGVAELRELRAAGQAPAVLDVRRQAEYAAGHVPGAVHLPLDQLEARFSELDAREPLAVICAGGYRSSAAASLLQKRGFQRVRNVVGGTSAWLAAGYEREPDAGYEQALTPSGARP
jgi:hydroxyacylglutathione hydrolase